MNTSVKALDVLWGQPNNTTKEGTVEYFDQLLSNYQVQHCEDGCVWGRLFSVVRTKENIGGLG